MRPTFVRWWVSQPAKTAPSHANGPSNNYRYHWASCDAQSWTPFSPTSDYCDLSGEQADYFLWTYLVVTAIDGMEALTVARESRPDLILLDMMLPKLDGPSVLQALKADSVTARIPVVVVTGLSQKNEEKLLKAGAAAFVEKNLLLENDKSLLDTIKKALEGRAA